MTAASRISPVVITWVAAVWPIRASPFCTLLMTSALRAFRTQGLSTASLSVTVDNRHAYRLYERLGFRLRKEFAAHAWVRPPARIEIPA